MYFKRTLIVGTNGALVNTRRKDDDSSKIVMEKLAAVGMKKEEMKKEMPLGKVMNPQMLILGPAINWQLLRGWTLPSPLVQPPPPPCDPKRDKDETRRG